MVVVLDSMTAIRSFRVSAGIVFPLNRAASPLMYRTSKACGAAMAQHAKAASCSLP